MRAKSPGPLRALMIGSRSAIFCLLVLLAGAGLLAQVAAGQASTAADQAPTAATGAEDAQAPAALLGPAMLGPLVAPAPRTFDAGPFGKLQISGILSVFGSVQDRAVSGDKTARFDISNAQIFVQKSTGLLQFFLQAGAYSLPALGSPLLSTADTVGDYYGALPQAFLRLAPKGSFSILIGKLPTLVGGEDTFTFQNLNIQRGLLWNQESAVNRGVQAVYSKGKLSAFLAWNDGYYSNHYNWLWGSATYSPSAADSIQLLGGGNFGRTGKSTLATPLYQNNGDLYNLIWVHTAKRWSFQPYLQYTHVPANANIGVGRATSTLGESLAGAYTVAGGLTMAGRGEYISSTGSAADGSVNLLYGPGSRAWSLTLTPTYQKKSFFARAEFSFTQALNFQQGKAFGANKANGSQARGMVETGFIF